MQQHKQQSVKVGNLCHTTKISRSVCVCGFLVGNDFVLLEEESGSVLAICSQSQRSKGRLMIALRWMSLERSRSDCQVGTHSPTSRQSHNSLDHNQNHLYIDCSEGAFSFNSNLVYLHKSDFDCSCTCIRTFICTCNCTCIFTCVCTCICITSVKK